MGYWRDFMVESEGNCFLCWSKISPHSPPPVKLEALSRYLRMDMSKVFSSEAPIPQQLLDDVKRSKLKVELCEGCTNLIENFSKLYRQLEKTEMEVACCLELIRGKLVGCGRVEQNCKEGSRLMDKIEIAKALRSEAFQKCSRKLSYSRPRIKARNLTMTQVNSEKLKLKKIKPRPRKDLTTAQEEASVDADYYPGIEMDDHGNECGSNFSADHPDEAEDAINFDNINDAGGIKVERDLELEHCSQPVSLTKIPEVKRKDTEIGQLSASIPEPIKVVGIDGKPQQMSINSATGKYECQLCQKEYKQKIGFQQHFKVAHLKEKYECRRCGKRFTKSGDYRRHYLSSHMGVRFKCTECNKVFTSKEALKAHQDAAHLGKRFDCPFCSKTFTRANNMGVHMIKYCPLKPSPSSS